MRKGRRGRERGEVKKQEKEREGERGKDREGAEREWKVRSRMKGFRDKQ